MRGRDIAFGCLTTVLGVLAGLFHSRGVTAGILGAVGGVCLLYLVYDLGLQRGQRGSPARPETAAPLLSPPPSVHIDTVHIHYPASGASGAAQPSRTGVRALTAGSSVLETSFGAQGVPGVAGRGTGVTTSVATEAGKVVPPREQDGDSEDQ